MCILGSRGKIAVGALTALFLAAVSSILVGRLTFERRMSREVDELFAASRIAHRPTLTDDDLEGLPEPVQRWLQFSRVAGKQPPATVRLKQEGEFRLEGRGWMPFRAEQYFTTDPPGFVWTVTMEMAPLLSVTGRDRYVGGTGDIEMRLLALIPVASKSGGGLDQGALLRFLGEMVWFPAAALNPYIRWEGIDARSARATMSYGAVTASATFVFDEQGRPVSIEAERYNDARGGQETWSVPISAHGEFNGVRVPVEGEGVWQYNTGDFSYIRWRITEIEVDQPMQY